MSRALYNRYADQVEDYDDLEDEEVFSEDEFEGGARRKRRKTKKRKTTKKRGSTLTHAEKLHAIKMYNKNKPKSKQIKLEIGMTKTQVNNKYKKIRGGAGDDEMMYGSLDKVIAEIGEEYDIAGALAALKKPAQRELAKRYMSGKLNTRNSAINAINSLMEKYTTHIAEEDEDLVGNMYVPCTYNSSTMKTCKNIRKIESKKKTTIAESILKLASALVKAESK